MLKLRKIFYLFARSRQRRQMKLQPKFKQYATNFEIEQQINELRRQDGQSEIEAPFSEMIKKEKPKLKSRFYVDQQKLNKKIKKVYKEQIKFEKIDTRVSDSMDFLNVDKSHLFDQSAEVEFEEKFRKQLFKTKQTKRLVEKKRVNPDRHLKGSEDQEFVQYEENKNKLKNSRIKNMLGFNKNNEQLQALIESGLINNPQNLKIIANKLKDNQKQLPFQDENHNYLVVKEDDQKDESELIKDLQDIGPEQLKYRGKIVEFFQNYQEMNEEDRKICEKDLQLMSKIKEYENKTFLQRYEAINFRFKGKVDFDFFKQKELISYIKNENIDTKDLLNTFKQNFGQLSKFNLPIMTPAVMSAVYSKTSLYQFPETDDNNRVNMLQDKTFMMLERQTFRNIQKLSNTDFSSCVWAYSHNHEEEQGILNKTLSNKINEVIFNQLEFRIANLNDEDLGLVARALQKLPLTKYSEEKWKPFVQFIQKRLPILQDEYAKESIFRLLASIPETPKSLAIAKQNIGLFQLYKWQEKYTLSSFVFVAGMILKHKKNLTIMQKQKLKEIMIKQSDSLQKIIPQFSLNFIPQFLTVFGEANAFLQMEKIVNLVKKTVIDNINQQKQIIRQFNLPLLAYNLALIDYKSSICEKKTKIKKIDEEQLMQNLMRKLCLRILTSSRIYPYNSSQYFLYHGLANLAHSQLHTLSPICMARIAEALSIVHYKNQPLFDAICHNFLDKFDDFNRQRGYDPSESQGLTILKENKISKAQQLITMANCFGFSKRNNLHYQQIISKLFNDFSDFLPRIPANQVLRFLTTYISLQRSSQYKQASQNKAISHILSSYIFPLLKIDAILEQQLASLLFVSQSLNIQPKIRELIQEKLKGKKQLPESKIIRCFDDLFRKNDENSKKKFRKCEKAYKEVILRQIMQNQQRIGTPLSYQVVFDRLLRLIQNKYGKQNVNGRAWTIEVPQKKKVYFVATYDHLMTFEESPQKITVSLFGIWKLYEKYYRDWSFHLVCSFNDKVPDIQ